MKKNYSFLVFTILLLNFSLFGQTTDDIWSIKTDSKKPTSKPIYKDNLPEKYMLYNLNVELLKSKLTNVSHEKGSGKSTTIISFPDENGKMENFRINEISVLEDGLQDKFPNLKSYIGKGINNKDLTIRFSLTKLGLNAIMLINEEASIHIKPYTLDKLSYIVFSSKHLQNEPFNCGNEVLEDQIINKKDRLYDKYEVQKSSAVGTLRTFRIALAVTGELSQFILKDNGTDVNVTDYEKKSIVLGHVVNQINLVNAVFERDMAITFKIVASELDLIFLYPESDLFTGTDNIFKVLSDSQNIFNQIIAQDNYDIGHVLGDSMGGAGGAAGGGICSTNKARAVSNNYIGTIIHEIGHQFGAGHTYNYCIDSGWGNGIESVEVECGQTIMSYGGPDTHFHLKSIQIMKSYVYNTDCGVITQTGNSVPEIEELTNYTIPLSTPFFLDGSASDADGDELMYSWEQLDADFATYPLLPSNTQGPLYEWSIPTSESRKNFPDPRNLFEGIPVNGNGVLPSVGRTMKFGLIVRDNYLGGGQTAIKETVLTFDENSGPFKVVTPGRNDNWEIGTPQTITWDVSNTDKAPISCSAVDILLSIDGGRTFPLVLASNITNNGSYQIIVPNVSTDGGVVKVESVNSVFYSINVGYVKINPTTGLTFIPDVNFEQALIDLGYDDVLDNHVLTTKINNVNQLELSNRNIANLTGIEDFSALTSLSCSSNQLTSLDISMNKALINLSCNYNQITSLDVSNNLYLKTLGFQKNELTSIDVSQNLALESLNCGINRITSLDLIRNTDLKSLTCYYNQLTSLDLRNNTALSVLNCSVNQLASLDLSQNTVLNWIETQFNELISLDVSNNKVLDRLDVKMNRLTSLDLSQNKSLSYLRCVNNQIFCIKVNQSQFDNTPIDWHKDDQANYKVDCSNQWDDDGDNVTNNKDLCPNTEIGEEVNIDGCSNNQLFLDNDNDNVRNGMDLCPNTPSGQTVNTSGCSQSQIDDDGDGVMNDKDLCSNTASGTNVNANGCFFLPSNNFSIEVIGETCTDKNNGKISITAQATHNYVAIINGVNHNFTNNSLSVSNLSPGTYNVCIKITGVTFEQCFTITIAEGKTVSGKSSVTSNKTSIEIAEGTAPYNVSINGITVLNTLSPSFMLEVKHGDLVEVKTAVLCEGVFSKTIDLFEEITAYPNPTNSVFDITLPFSVKEVYIELFTVSAQLISKGTYQVVNGKVQLNLENKPTGVYVVKIYLDTPVSLTIIKE